MALSFTGLAQINGQWTIDWITDFLASISFSQITLPELAQKFQNYAKATFSTLKTPGKYNGIIFIISGFHRGKYILIKISNMPNGYAEGNWYFQVSRNKKYFSSKLIDYDVNGMKTKFIIDNICGRLRRLRRKLFYTSPEDTVNVLVSLIRAANSSEKSAIGRNCTSIIIDQNSETKFMARAHRGEGNSWVPVPPAFFSGVVVRDVYFGPSDKMPPLPPIYTPR